MSAKSRLSVYLEPTLLRALERFALEHRKSKSLVAEAAISAFLAPDAVERPDAALIRRLDHQNRTAERADRNLAIVIEMLALFIRFWLTITPPLSDSAQASARAKGVGWRRVLTSHVLTGTLLPVIAYLGPATAAIITGSILIETMFAVPGIGRHFVDAALNRDYPLVMGITLLYGGLLILFNIGTDVIRAILDPRIRNER